MNDITLTAAVRRFPRDPRRGDGDKPWLALVTVTTHYRDAPVHDHRFAWAYSHPEALQQAHLLHAQADRELMDEVYAGRAARIRHARAPQEFTIETPAPAIDPTHPSITNSRLPR